MKLAKDNLVRLPLVVLLTLSMALGGVPGAAWAEAVEEAESSAGAPARDAGGDDASEAEGGKD